MADDNRAPKKTASSDAPKKRKFKKTIHFGTTKKEQIARDAEEIKTRLLKAASTPEAPDVAPGGQNSM